MAFITIAVVASVLLQIYYAFTCGIAWASLVSSDRLFAGHSFDAQLLHALIVAKVLVAPMSFVLLAVRPHLGKVFTGSSFLVYGISGLAMPILANSLNPMAWWPNLRAAGEGPVISCVFVVLGGVLLLHRSIIRGLADEAGTAPAARSPDSA